MHRKNKPHIHYQQGYWRCMLRSGGFGGKGPTVVLAYWDWRKWNTILN